MCKSLRFLAQMTCMSEVELLTFMNAGMYRDHSSVNNFENSFPVKMTIFKIVYVTVIYIHFGDRKCFKSTTTIHVIWAKNLRDVHIY